MHAGSAKKVYYPEFDRWCKAIGAPSPHSFGRGRCTAFCVVKGNETEIGRTGNSPIGVVGTNSADPMMVKSTTKSATGAVSWEGPASYFAVPCSSQSGGVLPQITVEVWATDQRNAIPLVHKADEGVRSVVQLIGVAKIGPDYLVSEPIGSVSIALEAPGAQTRRTSAGAPSRIIDNRVPQVVVRFTPQAGQTWARRAMLAARAAKPADSNFTESNSDYEPASVLYMSAAEGSARTWRTPVTRGGSMPASAYDDVLGLIFASLPAYCPQSPQLAVAPISDVGVRIGEAWIGPQPAVRYAFVAFRSDHALATNKASNEELPPPPSEDEIFLRSTAAEAEGILREVRARDMRAEQRKLALSRVREICEEWCRARRRGTGAAKDDAELRRWETAVREGNTEDVKTDHEEREDDEEDSEDEKTATGRAYGELFSAFLGALEVALPGVSVYIGLLERGGQSIHYVACTRGSTMAGKELRRGEGISFSCVGPHHVPYLIYPPRSGLIPGFANEGTYADEQLPNKLIAAKSPSFGMAEGRHRDSSQPGPSKEVLHTSGIGVVKGPEADAEEEASGAKLSRETALTETRGPVQRSLEEEIVLVQKVFRGRLGRNRLARPQGEEVGSKVKKDKWGRLAKKIAKQKPRPMPKVFDYDGRIGWPFVCVPLVASLGMGSLGVVGMDTFEQMGCGRNVREQPEVGVVEALAEAAR